ncbi:MAG TPA: hypothetical protein P5530_00015 [Candidatus Diapherotrites archaeon]|jgi:hypothetical protein|nr:hypothetical protein [Candidatus Diapherotrites archaeon]
MALTKTINNYETFIQELKLEKNKDKPYLDAYFKKKFIILENKRIIHPNIRDLEKKITELQDTKEKLKKLKRYWEKEKDKAQNYYRDIKLKKYFKGKFWKHKLKQALNPEYREDVINCKLTDEVIMDPEYGTLADTFLVDYDYRKKLADTVTKSLIYKDSVIGDYNKKRQQFKKENASTKIDQITEKISQTNLEILAYQTVIKYIKMVNR